MEANGEWALDVMQVCRNGHVITDLLISHPERGLAHCDRCGAVTLSQCSTCGQALAGALAGASLEPIGSRRPPSYCSRCGASFPWAPKPRMEGLSAEALLERLLRSIPRVARELRVRQTDRPPFRIHDERDLEDLLRALLPIHFDDVRPECRTPRYALGTRADFVLASEEMVVTAKIAQPGVTVAGLLDQLKEDTIYYQHRAYQALYGYVHDPARLVWEDGVLATAASALDETLKVHCIIGQEPGDTGGPPAGSWAR